MQTIIITEAQIEQDYKNEWYRGYINTGRQTARSQTEGRLFPKDV